MSIGINYDCYSTKSGYYTAVNTTDTDAAVPNGNGFKWKKSVWNLPCAPKVKLFSWKLLKGAIPVGERLAERHIPVDPLCKRCGCSESISHLMFRCQFAQRVWQLAPFKTDLDISGTIDLISSWDSLCDLNCLLPAGITSGTLFPWILWAIWKARNKFVFEGHSASPEDRLSSAIRLTREWAMEVIKDSITKPRLPIPTTRAPPRGGGGALRCSMDCDYKRCWSWMGHLLRIRHQVF